MKVFMIAGEASGDVLGARIMRDAPKGFSFSGIGGAEMQEAGLTPLFPMQELSVMGVAEILPRLPNLLRRIRETQDAILAQKPDVILTIDSPDFSFRVVKGVKAKWPQAKAIHMVAPTVWAWRQERAKKMAALYDRLFCLFPFEPAYFTEHGLDARFVGHPIIDTYHTYPPINRQKNDFLVLFGSRMGEIKRIAPVFMDVCRVLRGKNPEISIYSPVFDHLKPVLQDMAGGLPIEWVPATQRYELFARCGRAMAVSGTAGLELSVFGCPHVIGYKMNPLTYALIKGRVQTPYAHLENIIQNEMLVPEFLQQNCTVDALIEGVQSLPEEMSERQSALMGQLQKPDGFVWSDPSLYAF